jgi:hypothetical protein
LALVLANFFPLKGGHFVKQLVKNRGSKGFIEAFLYVSGVCAALEVCKAQWQLVLAVKHNGVVVSDE